MEKNELEPPSGTVWQVYNKSKILYTQFQNDTYEQNVIIKLLNNLIVIFSLIIIEIIIVFLYFKLLKLALNPLVTMIKALFLVA
jgi:hypothetical protein